MQYLRKLNGGMTQEKLAEKMGVSRQMIGKWEAGESWPEVDKLIQLADLFNCKVDALLREDMAGNEGIYSPVRLEETPAFLMARYVIISPNPEDDANGYIRNWMAHNGLQDCKMIGWDFPFVSVEQKNRFNLRGYVAACILPDGFEAKCPGVEIAIQEKATYAAITVRDPFIQPFERISGGYKQIMKYLDAKGFKDNCRENVLQCFESVYEQDGETRMDIFIHADGVGKANLYTGF